MHDSGSKIFVLKSVWAILLIILTAGFAASQKSPFTVTDSLRIKSFRPASLTDDGRFAAGTISMSLSRLGTDHKRYRDPTYISPRPVEAVILDTEKGTILPLFNHEVEVRGMTWSPDGKKLAFFKRTGDEFFLHTFDREKGTIQPVPKQTSKSIASGSELVWTKSGNGVLLTLREEGWKDKAEEMYREAAVGPVTVYDSREPFLKWDVIRDHAMLGIIALVDIQSGELRELGPEQRVSRIQIAGDDSYITFLVTHPVKTEYGKNYYQNGGREYELFKLGLEEGSEPKNLMSRGKKQLRISWNEENTLFAWEDEGDIFIQSVDETEGRNLTKDKVTPEEAGEKKKEEKEETDNAANKDEKSDKKDKVRFALTRFSPDGSRLLASTKKGLWLIDHQSGKLEMVYHYPEDEEDETGQNASRKPQVLAWSPDSRMLYMSHAATDRWERGFTRYDLETRKMQELVKDTNLYRGLTLSKNGQKFLYRFSNGDLPDDYYSTDKDFQRQNRLTELNPWIEQRKLTRSELITYLDADGKKLYGVLYYPVDYQPGKKYPLVCEIYERFFDNGFNTSMNIITNQGWFGLRPSVNLEEGYPGEAWIKGVTSAVNKLIEEERVDPKKIGIHGTSYGGYAVSLLITQTSRFAAAVNISGKVNIISFLGDSPRIGHRNYGAAEAGQDRLGKTLWEAPLKYINHSAVMFADRIKTPHLLITGEGDWNVPGGNTRELYYALRRLGKECVWVDYRLDGHGLGAAADEATYQDKWNRVIDWYKTHFDKVDKN